MSILSRMLRVVVCGVIVLSVGACATSRGPSPLADNPSAMPRFATHVFVGDCIFRQSGAESAFLAPILSSVISQTFNRIGTALAASAREQTWTITSTTNFELSSTDFPDCVQVVRGVFYGDPDKANFSWAAGSPFEPHKEQLKRKGIVLGAKPDFFFEGVFRPARGDGAVAAVVPVVSSFEKPVAERALRSDSSRHVTLAFAFHTPGKAPSDATNPGTDLILGQLNPGVFTRYDQSCAPDKKPAVDPATPIPDQPGPDQPDGQPVGDDIPSQPGGAPLLASLATDSASSVPMPTTPAIATATIGARACPGESRWFGVERSEKLAPLSVTVAVSEMQGASAFLSFLADVFSDSKDELETLTKQTLISSEREKARLATLQAEQAASVAYDRAVAAALASLAACSSDEALTKTAEAHINQLADARINQQSANLAAHQAGRPQPFASLVELTMTPANAQVACTTAIKAFQ